MSKRRPEVEIARWEFLRWFKLKDQILTLIISCGIGVLVWGGRALLDRESRDPVTVRVINLHLLPIALPERGGFQLQAAPADSEAALRQAVTQRTIEGLLILKSADEAELVVSRFPRWQDELQDQLTKTRVQSKVRALGLPNEQVAEAFQPFRLRVVFDAHSDRPAGLAEKIAAGVIIGLMLLGLLVSFAYLRVTEQIISAVSPQQWIDGKILGLSAFASVSTLTYVVSILIFVGISGSFGEALEIPAEVASPGIVAALIFLGLSGYLLWNTFFAAVAATINDPNTSAKGSLIFVPMIVTIGSAAFAVKDPDSVISQALSMFPLTSPAALACRLVLTEVPGWQIVTAILLMLGGIWLLRRAAGKIFHLGVLMYGKEPGLREMIRWLRET
jgi:ABC-2 type transport system permease protein